VEIGSTWLTEEAQRTAVNTHAKLLMLTHAFEGWEVRRVMLKTDARNMRSRTAIERLGARFDGVLRAHMPAFDGAVRDTAFYSILAAEWPDVRTGLRERASGSAVRDGSDAPSRG
jgi:RimJ/RimL family protein N-acetyltransferase